MPSADPPPQQSREGLLSLQMGKAGPREGKMVPQGCKAI